MDCPRCKTNLENQIIHEQGLEIELDVCPSCHGTWFDEGELQRVDQIIEPVVVEIRRIPNARQQLEGLHCPSCNNLMEKHEHPRDQKVIMDFCSDCKGFWLDRGELNAIQKENLFSTLSGLFRILNR
jgi:Zn-finger nucleic acid-binding protein